MKTKAKNRKVKPLSEQERIDYLNDLDDLGECREAALAFGRALLDIKRRKLWREDYKSWKEFVEKCPKLRGHSRQWSYYQMDWAKGVEELSTQVDTSDLTEKEWRCLKAISCIPDRAEVKKRLRDADMTINEQNVEKFLHELMDEKARAQKLKNEIGLFDPDEDEGGEEEDEALSAMEESPDEKRRRERAPEFDKERTYASRGNDQHRLGNRSWNKTIDDDWRDAADRAKGRQIIAATRKACDRVEKILNKCDAEDHEEMETGTKTA